MMRHLRGDSRHTRRWVGDSEADQKKIGGGRGPEEKRWTKRQPINAPGKQRGKHPSQKMSLASGRK